MKSQRILKTTESAGSILRFWRKHNRISQMDLALDAGISPRHLSFVETGRSQPSRGLVLRLAKVLKIPLRHQNVFLKAAGYAPEFSEEPFDGKNMVMIRDALQRMLDSHEPYPAMVVNSSYRVLTANTGFERFVTHYLGEEVLRKYNNAFRLIFEKDGFRQVIRDWPMVESFLLARLWEESLSSQNKELFALYEDMAELADISSSRMFTFDQTPPVMSLALEKDGVQTRFFTTITTLGTPLDLTTQELRIECLFPADDETRNIYLAADGLT